MATIILTKLEADASAAAPLPIEALAGGRPKAPVILALDLGQRTGWAVRNRDGAIASGVQEFRPGRFEGGGMIWLRFRAWLQEVDETSGGVGVVVFEEVRRHLGTTAAMLFGGYLAHLTAWAEANRIPYQGVPVGTIKRHIAGKGNTDKQAVIDAVRLLGFQPGGRQRGRRAGVAELGDRAGDRRRSMNGAMLLQHAAGVIEHRERIYGPPSASFDAIAARWSLVLGIEISPAQVALCLIDLKLARLSRDPSHLDSIVDVAGYAACLREVTRA